MSSLTFSHLCSFSGIRSIPRLLPFKLIATQNTYARINLRQHVFGHLAPVSGLKYDQNSSYLISVSFFNLPPTLSLQASSDGLMKIWSLWSPKPEMGYPLLRHSLRGHTSPIKTFDISLDNHLLVSIDTSCILVVWCLRTGQPLVSFKGSERNESASGLSMLPIFSTYGGSSGELASLFHPILSSPLEKREGWIIVATEGLGLHFIRYTHDIYLHRVTGSNRFIENCCNVHLHRACNFSLQGQESGDNCKALSLQISPGNSLVLLVSISRWTKNRSWMLGPEYPFFLLRRGWLPRHRWSCIHS